MRPRVSKQPSGDGSRNLQAWSNGSLAQQYSLLEEQSDISYHKISTSYSLDELLQVWDALQQRLKSSGFEQQYRSLDPIRDLVSQVHHDLSVQQSKPNNPRVTELSAKLGEIDQWAQKQQNGLDFASILGGIKSQRNGSAVQSPFASRAPLQRESSFSGVNSPISNGASQLPFLNTQPQTVQPDAIQWEYLDHQGNLQGPFDGQMMQGWFEQGYLQLDLQLKREGQPKFITIRDLISMTGNARAPFLMPLPAQSLPAYSNLGFESQSSFSSPGFLHNTTAQLPQVHTAQQSSLFATSGRSSPWASQSALATPTLSGHDFGLQNQSSFFSDYNDPPSITATAGNSFVNQQPEEDLFSHIHSQALNNVLTDDAVPVVKTPIGETSQGKEQTVVSNAQPKSVVSTKKEPAKKQAKPKILETKAEVKPSPKSVVAPWANKPVVESTEPRLTLEQIQQLESEEHLMQMKLKAEKDRLSTAQLFADTEREMKEAEIKQSLPATASWATANPAATPTKTFLDIQREEAAAAAAASPSGVKTTNKPQPSKISFASIATSSTTNANAWTTVTSKKPVPKAQPPATTNSLKQVTPDMLRSISAPAQVAAPVQAKSVSPRQEFLAWCRASLKLNNGVKLEDILEIMLMLPVSQESSEIIADTIYSNSSTMDGRRFAQEFMKRRRTVEAQVNDGLSWTDALHISAMDDNDGWDFQVVKKKGRRRN